MEKHQRDGLEHFINLISKSKQHYFVHFRCHYGPIRIEIKGIQRKRIIKS